MTSVLASIRTLAATAASVLPGMGEIGALSDADEKAALAELSAVHEQVGACVALFASDIERRSSRELGAAGLAQSAGLRSGAELVQKLTGSSIADARKLVRTGGLLETAESVAPAHAFELRFEPPVRSLDALRSLPGGWDAPIAVAVRNSWLSPAQADALREGLGAPRTPELEARWRQAALELIGDAWDAALTPEDLRSAARKVRACLDAAAAQADARARYEARSLRRFRLRNGNWRWDLEVDPETDAALWSPLSRRLSPRLGGPRFRSEAEQARVQELQDDPRSNEQLLLDEFASIYTAGVHAGGTALFGSAEPQLSVAVTTAELTKARNAGRIQALHETGDHSRCPQAVGPRGAFGQADCPGPDHGIAWLDGTDEPLTATSVLHLLCDGGYTPLLFDETGQAIDVAKDQRFFSHTQRRAMALRDGGCRWPGCHRPPGECEAHHRNPWAADPANRKSETRDGILLCKFHHLNLHNHGAWIERDGSTYWLHWPGDPPVELVPKSGVQVELSALPFTGAGAGVPPDLRSPQSHRP